MSLDISDRIPDLTLPASGGVDIRLRDFEGRNLVLYFYPKDNTPGCTQEGQDFGQAYDAFQAAQTDILGISRDSVRAHDNFIAKYDFPFPLLSDKDEQACDAFSVIVEKNMYGRKYLGIDRSTWLFDKNGKLRQVWRKVKVKGHVDQVLEAARAL
ncbi:MAG: peroxiredoxin [Panacagrimonas sp.]